MLTIEREDGVMFLDASGHISAADIEAFEPVFEQFADMQGKVPMVIDATELEGYEPAALWHDMKFDTTHRDQIGPAAIISGGGWKAWATKLSKAFFKEPMRHFDAGEREEAKKWVLSQARQ